MRKVLRLHPVLLLGVLTLVIMWTSPEFLPDYDEGLIGNLTFAVLYLLTSPFAFFASILRPLSLPDLVRGLIANACGLAVYLGVDFLLIRLARGGRTETA
jgi:hypothetical protein